MNSIQINDIVSNKDNPHQCLGIITAIDIEDNKVKVNLYDDLKHRFTNKYKYYLIYQLQLYSTLGSNHHRDMTMRVDMVNQAKQTWFRPITKTVFRDPETNIWYKKISQWIPMTMEEALKEEAMYQHKDFNPRYKSLFINRKSRDGNITWPSIQWLLSQSIDVIKFWTF